MMFQNQKQNQNQQNQNQDKKKESTKPKKRVEYLDNYQYHETKNIKDNDPKKLSIVTHQRLGDIVGGSYETSTYSKQTLTDSGTGPKLYSSSTTTTSSKKYERGRPTGTTSTTRSTR